MNITFDVRGATAADLTARAREVVTAFDPDHVNEWQISIEATGEALRTDTATPVLWKGRVSAWLDDAL